MSFPAIRARWFHTGGNTPVDRVVIHRMESPNKGDTAVAVARYFAALPSSRRASAHYCVDNTHIVQCVDERDTAFHAPPNRYSIGIEHAGYSADNDWAEAYGAAMLELSASLCADICKRYHLPAVWLSVADLLAGARGITSHNNVSQAWHQSTHTDPGAAFPVDAYLARVRAHLDTTTPHAPPAPAPIVPIPVPTSATRRPEMFLVRQTKTDAVWITDGARLFRALPNPHVLAMLSQRVGDVLVVDAEQFAWLRDATS